MRKIARWLIAMILMTTVGMPLSYAADTSAATDAEETFKGVWVATVLNIDYPKKGTTDVESLKKQAIEILDRAEANGMNAVILQVRPSGDALYKSTIFPWSKYLTGTQGTAPEGGFDPLAFWIDEAHKRNLELHAWINPFRVTKKTKNDPSHDYQSLAANNPARLHPEWTVKHNDGNIYFDPGIPDARSLIVDGVAEIITNYDVDGIHFDDYFYPGTDFEDSATYKAYGADYKTIGDFRRANVDALVAEVHSMIKTIKPEVSFGISPFGIWANKKDNPQGSDTRGLQSYYEHYADSKGWVEKGLVDYIAPQLYWNIGYEIADYAKLANWWNEVCMDSDVALYIGHGAYRTGNSDSSSPWYGVDEIKRQLDYNQSLQSVKGSIFYNNTAFVNQPALGALTKSYFAQTSTVSTPTQTETQPQVVNYSITPVYYDLLVSRPSEDLKTTAEHYFIAGASNRDLPLYLNGEKVLQRTTNGFFGLYVTLKDGKNTFTFTQGDKTVTRTITKGTSTSTISPMSTYKISASTTFPQNKEMRRAGEKITFSCKAPIGAKMTVSFNGQTYTMTPKVAQSPDGKIYATTYTYDYTMPEVPSGKYEVDMGNPKYVMSFGQYQDESIAPENVLLLSKSSVYSIAVDDTIIDLYKEPVSGNGVAANLTYGMMDQVTGMTGTYVRLASGYWANKNSVNIVKSATPYQGKIVKLDYQSTTNYDRFNVGTSGNGAVIATYDGKTIKVKTSSLSNAGLKINNDFIKTIDSDGSFEIAAGTLKGYYIEQTASGYSLVMLKPIAKKAGVLPLEGYVILLDPGHGGSDSGARGLLGSDYTEKTINLSTALLLKSELESRGAVVKMTRESDVDVSLKERLQYSLQVKPDLFISIHADSLSDTEDITNVYGFSTFYKDPVGKRLSETILKQVVTDLGRKSRGANQKNYYVTRGTWTPSILIETGFVGNPFEYEWLMDSKSQASLVETIAKGIETYFASYAQ